ncbi:MAG: lamin tail domain-containing protein [Polyangiaceae bacterium]
MASLDRKLLRRAARAAYPERPHGDSSATWRRTGLLLLPWLALAASCSVYDESLLEGDGAGGAGGSGAGSTSGGGGGELPCGRASDCPGEDTECRLRTCESGICGVILAPQGAPLGAQTPADCQLRVCDGTGAETAMPVDDDPADDGRDCTTDSCLDGLAMHTPVRPGAPCNQDGGQVCADGGLCVECLGDGDCGPDTCVENQCIPASCMDGSKNGLETDTDCGGTTCLPCIIGDACLIDTDCETMACDGGTCVATCSDGAQNQGETDLDCGGPCPGCQVGQGCAAPDDCLSGTCQGNKCQCVLGYMVISEVRSRGAAGANDEFVELYNPTAAAIALDATWKLESRSTEAGGYTDRWVGTGVSVPAKSHLLIGGSTYTQAPAKDTSLSSGITDAGSLKLTHGGVIVDAVCFSYSPGTSTSLQAVGYDCEGVSASNLPHNNGNSAGSSSDASIERKPGGALGSCADTQVSSVDWQSLAPAQPQSLASPPVP